MFELRAVLGIVVGKDVVLSPLKWTIMVNSLKSRFDISISFAPVIVCQNFHVKD